MMRYSNVVLILLALSAGAPAAAQTVSGQLLGAATRQPIGGGTMSLLSDNAPIASVFTDSAGTFVLRAPRAGSFRLRAERIGYRVAETSPLELAAGDTLTTDLLRGVAGVHPTPSRRGTGSIVQLRGGCIPRVFLDGLRIQLLGMTIDDLVRPAELEGIEIYRGAGELPAEFAHGACGAVVLWTRRGF
ncbi:MAG: carboxypeptidase regulatory-like domain-containing protein [Longimicrobiales bacterium]